MGGVVTGDTMKRKQRTFPATTTAYDCQCEVQRATIGDDHTTSCPLYRRRGSGVSILNGPQAYSSGNWIAASGKTGRSSNQ